MTIFDTASTVANGVAVSARPNRSIRSARDSGGASAAIPDALVSPSFERNVLISRIDEDVRALWGVKAAVRVGLRNRNQRVGRSNPSCRLAPGTVNFRFLFNGRLLDYIDFLEGRG